MIRRIGVSLNNMWKKTWRARPSANVKKKVHLNRLVATLGRYIGVSDQLGEVPAKL
jgi:hypothetical protein